MCLNISKAGMDFILSSSSSHSGEVLGDLLTERNGRKMVSFPLGQNTNLIFDFCSIGEYIIISAGVEFKQMVPISPYSYALLGESGILGSMEKVQFFSSLLQMPLPIIYILSLEKLASPTGFFLKSLWTLYCSPSH